MCRRLHEPDRISTEYGPAEETGAINPVAKAATASICISQVNFDITGAIDPHAPRVLIIEYRPSHP